MKIVVMLGLLATLSFNLTARASEVKKEADAANGKAVSATCAACHGADGNSVNPDWPKIAGQGEAYLAKQLHDFRSDKRVDPSMTAMAKGIKSDSDVADLAAYYSSVKAKPGVANPEMIAKGEAIYKGGVVSSGVAACAACHGPTGSGNPAAKFPKISGQHAKYTVTQLMNFKSSKRANDTGKMMRNVALKMTDAEMDAVAEYISGLRN
ncbi:cytochrome c [uncultured Cocleimonas sp.]|uniref:c-type cytochrome n=1 Tax=uncultured Cocleimonas sp. TaxID=1051587 RepID=UPI0026074D44|nr:c-type cytochrome [uncultured Cocleimonas sp.]